MLVELIFGPEVPLLGKLRNAAHRHAGGTLRIAVAWARLEGVTLLLDAITPFIQSIEAIVGINEKATTVEALSRLLDQKCSLYFFYKHSKQTFHPKVYWFSGGKDISTNNLHTLFIGSANLTYGGLTTNYEASLAIELSAIEPASQSLLQMLATIWNELMSSPFIHRLSSQEDIEQLYQAGYILSEYDLGVREHKTTEINRPLIKLVTAPPPKIPQSQLSQTAMPPMLTMPQTQSLKSSSKTIDALLPQFYVRTLTDNDVEKLKGSRPGTFEPDLGQFARDMHPSFWGWPDKYKSVARRKQRQEWKTKGLLLSSYTPSEGIIIDVVLWYREERPGHPAEHRIRLGPIQTIRTAIPPYFDTSSLVVIERAPATANYTYIIRFITPKDPGYNDYATYLVEQRQKHRFGYGP